MKKLIALVIVAVMLLSMMPMVTLAAETKTVYFENNWLWTDVKIHYWGGSESTQWSGVPMTKSGTRNGHDVYSYTLPAGTTGIVFNGIKNDGSGALDQTPDIENEAIQTGVIYLMDWNNGNTYKTESYTPSSQHVETFDIYVKAPWETAHIWAWHENGDNDISVSTQWPGIQLSKVGDGWFTGRIPVSAGGQAVDRLIVAEKDGGAQTVDLTVTVADQMWVVVGTEKEGSNYKASVTTSNPDTSTDTTPIHVKLDGVSMSTAYLYVWGFPGGIKNEANGSWPGSALSADPYNSGWLTASVSSYTSWAIVNNNNGTQTEDMDVKLGEESWIVVTGTGSDGYSVSTTAPSGWYTSAPIKVTLDPGEGTVTSTTLTADPDGNVTLPAASRPNYVFDGWYKEAELTNLVGQAGETATFTENATIYAKWSEDVAGRHTITFKDGNNVITSAVTKKLDGNIGTLETLPAGPTAPANYKFVSWVLEDGTEVTTSTQFTAPTNVYAKWEQKPTYTVSFDLNYEGATGAPEAKSTIDGKIELPAASRTGYTFNGWYTAKTEGTKVDNDKVYEANTTLYAQWTKVEYVTVHASVPETWTTAFVYAWNTGAGSNEAWPGAPMTKGTDGWFTAQVPVGYGNLIIAEKDGGEQTKDLTGINQTATEIWVTLTEKEGDKYKADVTYPSDINTDPSEYYLHGYINGADVTGTTYKFVDGKVTVNLTAESYVFVGTDIGSNFMTDGWLGKEVKEATLATDYATGDKLFVPAGNVTFTLVVNDDGTVKLSYAVAAPEGGNQGGTEGGNQGGNQSGTAGNPEAPAGGTEGGSEVEEITINVKVPADWENPCLWAWQENGDNDINAFDAWPGMALTKGENGWYYAKVPANMNYMIVNAHNGAWQTPDTAIEKSKCDVWAEVVVDAAGQATIKMQYTSPATGDTAIIAPVVFLMVMSVTGLAVLTVGKKKYF